MRKLLFAVVLLAACSSEALTTPGKGLGASCSTAAECKPGLSCVDPKAHFVAQTATCSGAIAAGALTICSIPCDLAADCSAWGADSTCSRFGCE